MSIAAASSGVAVRPILAADQARHDLHDARVVGAPDLVIDRLRVDRVRDHVGHRFAAHGDQFAHRVGMRFGKVAVDDADRIRHARYEVADSKDHAVLRGIRQEQRFLDGRRIDRTLIERDEAGADAAGGNRLRVELGALHDHAQDHLGRRARLGEGHFVAFEIADRLERRVFLHQPGEVTVVVHRAVDDLEIRAVLNRRHRRRYRRFAEGQAAREDVADRGPAAVAAEDAVDVEVMLLEHPLLERDGPRQRRDVDRILRHRHFVGGGRGQRGERKQQRADGGDRALNAGEDHCFRLR